MRNPALIWLLTSTLFGGFGCVATPSASQKLVGSWIVPQFVDVRSNEGEPEAYARAMRKPGPRIVNTFKADHTLTANMLGQRPNVTGRWRIEGSDLITGMAKDRKPLRVERVHIVKLDSNELVVSDGTTEGRLFRWH